MNISYSHNCRIHAQHIVPEAFEHSISTCGAILFFRKSEQRELFKCDIQLVGIKTFRQILLTSSIRDVWRTVKENMRFASELKVLRNC